MRFEKWHALGNDYVIVERQELEFELTGARVRRLCAPHTGVGADGVVLVSPPAKPGYAASLRIFNPDGSEAELSGNGVREASLYLRRHGWASSDRFWVRTIAGEIRVTVTSPTACTLDIGRVRLRSEDFPAGAPDGRGELIAAGRSWRFQHVQVGNPQCAIAVADGPALAALDLPAIGPGIERHELFPNRTNVSFYAPEARAPRTIRARIFERGVGETSASGTGATGAAVAFVLGGGDSPVTVLLDGGQLEVAVGEDLQVELTGPGVPVFRGELAEELVADLTTISE